MEEWDVVIVGAGLSGIGAAVHLSKKCPNTKFTILEGRDSIGGTWDQFRYPGVRSDSDMYTLGYNFKPWLDNQSMADGPSILQYISDTAKENKIDEKIRLSHRVARAEFSSEHNTWMMDIERGPKREPLQIKTKFLFVCSGYYRYDQGYTPEFPGVSQFKGKVVHPQAWPADLDYVDKRVVVIGSGATAVSLVPAMAEKAQHVTMLQRSPSYILSQPREDAVATWLYRFLPITLAYTLMRWKNMLIGLLLFVISRLFPAFVKKLLLWGVTQLLGKENHELLRHFTPTYNPWVQRLCLVPDGDIFKSIKDGRASVVTDHIKSFTPTGILLQSGEELPADIIVTATGLELLPMGGIKMAVDGKPVTFGDTVCYKGVMLNGVPNMAYVLGYINASWTLKADLACDYVCRLLNEMKARGATCCVPVIQDASMPRSEWTDLTSGYFQRKKGHFPKQGDRRPWTVNQNYLKDFATLSLGSISDTSLVMC